MKVIIFGATGMVGQGVLRGCLLDPEVTSVLTVGRTATGRTDAKLREIVHRDFTDFAPIAAQVTGYDACFYCLGISSAGMKEADYDRVTYDYAMAAAQTLVAANPGMTFVFVSGTGTDSSEQGRWMWARVKGKTENALMRLPFEAAYMMRPGYIQPVHGVTSKTRLYRVFYTVLAPFYPLLRRIFPRHVITTEELGRAMIAIARDGAPKPVLENADIGELARANGP